MIPYKFLPHTADVKFQAFGKTLAEAFKNAAYALTDVITDHKKIKPKLKKTIKVKSQEIVKLDFDFADEIKIPTRIIPKPTCATEAPAAFNLPLKTSQI